MSGGWFNKQTVARVFHIGNHACRTDGHRILRVFRGDRVLGPVATFRVEYKPELAFLLSSRPAQVDAPERCRLAIGEPEDSFIIHCDSSSAHGWASGVFREAHASFEFVPQTYAFL